ncbi:hypothetical protein INR49_026723 [Caranx melampygus]|nr:hypothetical protein INR49_026723 [Caranx melampygus]
MRILTRQRVHGANQQKEELCSCQLMPGKVLRMSLVEDILDVLRLVLEYFGVPPDMLIPVWTVRCVVSIAALCG